jgi:creatinine amidohydrolase
MTRSIVPLVLVALVVATSPARAATPDTVWLDRLTWTEVRELVRTGTTTVIVPTGGTEQNGPHLALGKHNVRVQVLAEAIARALGHTLVSPVLAYVPEGGVAPPTGHMRYPGTLTLPEPYFEAVLEFAARSLALHGFRDIVFLGDSGDNQAGQRAVARRLNRAWAAATARAHAIDAYYRASTDGARRILRTRGYRDAEIGAHAGALDTSLMLAIDPSLVRRDRLQPAAGGTGWPGADGDPSRATAEVGQAVVQFIVAETVDAIRQSIAQRGAPPARPQS